MWYYSKIINEALKPQILFKSFTVGFSPILFNLVKEKYLYYLSSFIYGRIK